MSDEKIKSVCLLIGVLGVSFAVTRCIPVIHEGQQNKLRTCTAAGNSYVNGDCIGSGRK